MGKNDVKAEAREHGEDRKHGDALTKALPFIEHCIALKQCANTSIMFFFA